MKTLKMISWRYHHLEMYKLATSCFGLPSPFPFFTFGFSWDDQSPPVPPLTCETQDMSVVWLLMCVSASRGCQEMWGTTWIAHAGCAVADPSLYFFFLSLHFHTVSVCVCVLCFLLCCAVVSTSLLLCYCHATTSSPGSLSPSVLIFVWAHGTYIQCMKYRRWQKSSGN